MPAQKSEAGPLPRKSRRTGPQARSDGQCPTPPTPLPASAHDAAEEDAPPALLVSLPIHTLTHTSGRPTSRRGSRVWTCSRKTCTKSGRTGSRRARRTSAPPPALQWVLRDRRLRHRQHRRHVMGQPRAALGETNPGRKQAAGVERDDDHEAATLRRRHQRDRGYPWDAANWVSSKFGREESRDGWISAHSATDRPTEKWRGSCTSAQRPARFGRETTRLEARIRPNSDTAKRRVQAHVADSDRSLAEIRPDSVEA